MQKAIYSFIIFFLLQGIIFSQSSVTERKLHNNWSFKQKGSENWFPATVPGCVHLDLMKNKIIKDPYFQLNESKVQWIDKKDWIYQKEFFLNEAINYQNHEIIFEGLDTYASVYLNDNLILKSNNMHRTHIADVKPFLKTGKNTLRVVLESPIKKGLELYNALGYTIPVSANDQAEKGQVEGGKRVNVFTRKAAYHYGWDWGPRLVTSGIWRPIILRSWNKCKIKDFNIKYSLDSSAMVSTNLLIESTVDQEPANITITLNDSIVVNKDFKLLIGEQNIISHFSIDHPKLWWPNGIGEQYLYDIKAQVTLKDNRVFANQKQGIRTIVLEVQDSTKSPNFFFKVNGYPVFSKGVNYIPQDIFLPRVSTKDYQKLLSAAANANMNMIRVWGGGIYEDDRFYELCDSLGLMVWQDFMFACAMYPGDSSFLENVRLEAIDNYNRIKKHTSIALWCGNNENLAAWKRWGWEATAIKEQSAQIADKIWHNYDTLFHHILPKVVRDYHPEHGHSKNTNATNYWASSPSASPGIPESYKTGDTHYWGVWWGKEPFENFNSKISPELNFSIYKQDSTFLNTKFHSNIKYQVTNRTSLYISFSSENSEKLSNASLERIESFKSKFFGFGYATRVPKKNHFDKTTFSFNINPSFGKRKDTNGSSHQIKLESTLSYLLDLNQRNSFYFKNSIGILNSKSYIENELFRIGGNNTIRGFKEQSLYLKEYLIQSIEYRYHTANNAFLYSITDLALVSATNQTEKLLGMGIGYLFSTNNAQINISTAIGSSSNTPINLKNTQFFVNWVNFF